MLKLGRVTKFTMLFLVLVFVFDFDLFKFSAAILEKGLYHFPWIFPRNPRYFESHCTQLIQTQNHSLGFVLQSFGIANPRYSELHLEPANSNSMSFPLDLSFSHLVSRIPVIPNYIWTRLTPTQCHFPWICPSVIWYRESPLFRTTFGAG